MAIRMCPLCQAEFLEFKNTCTHCGVALVDPSADIDIRLLEEDEQVIYDLSAWPIDAQTDTAMVFAESGLPHLWDGTDLIVPADHESSADRLLERIEDDHGLVGAEERDMIAQTEGESAGAIDAEMLEGLTEFPLDGWAANQRMELVERLVEAGIRHHWEDDCLVVPTERDEEVEAILNEVDPSGAFDASVGGLAEEMMDPREIASILFLTAERMRKGKVDAERYRDLLDALDGSEPSLPPFGFEPVVWAQVLELGEDLADAVGDDTDEVEAIAASLYDLLRPLI